MTDTILWRDICEHFCPNDQSLFEEVELSLSNPEGYFENFEEALWERGIEVSSSVKPWLALIDGLQSRSYLREFDWKLDAAELALQLERLHACRERSIELNALRTSLETGESLLVEASGALAKHSLGLLFLEMDGDCYPLMPIATERVPRAVILSKRLGETIHSWQ